MRIRLRLVGAIIAAIGLPATLEAGHEGRAGIGVMPFTAQPDSTIPEIGDAISELLKNHLAGELGKPERRGCTIAAVAAGKEREEVLKELELQRSRFVDPATRVGDGHLIPVNMTVSGTAVATASTTSWTATVKDGAANIVATTTGSFGADATHQQIDEAVGQTARDLVSQLCKSYQASGGGSGLKITPSRVASVLAPFQLQGTFPGGKATIFYTPTSATSGTHTYSAAGSGVTASGKGTYTISKQGETLILRQQESGCTAPVGACRNTTMTIRLEPEQR